MTGLPKFLIADDLDTDRVYVVHTVAPRFIAVVLAHGAETVLDPHWIDDPNAISKDDLKDVMREASLFYRRSVEESDHSGN